MTTPLRGSNAAYQAQPCDLDTNEIKNHVLPMLVFTQHLVHSLPYLSWSCIKLNQILKFLEMSADRWGKKDIKVDDQNQQVSRENVPEIVRKQWWLNKNGEHGDNKCKQPSSYGTQEKK